MRKPGLLFFLLTGALTLLFTPQVRAQVRDREQARRDHIRPLVVQDVDENTRVTLHGNTHPEARPENDRGKVADDYLIEHMLLQLRRSPDQERALEKFLEEQQTPGSPNYHRWISAAEFGSRYGLSDKDLDKLTHWLLKHRFTINVVYPSGMVIDFSGTAKQVAEAFHTDIHHLSVKGQAHVGNTSDPQIPAAFGPMVAGIVSLHDFSPHTMHEMRKSRDFTFPDPLGGETFAMTPSDLATIYNLNPLFNSGITGTGQKIVVIEDTDVFNTADWTAFRAKFGLTKYSAGTLATKHPAAPVGSQSNNCKRPGIIAPNDAEAILDAEWASAAAPNAQIILASCADTTITFGGLIALQNLINANQQPPAVMSVSYGQCETENGAAANAAYNAAYQQAAAEGVSVFVAAGDSGAAGCDNSVSEATHGIGVNAFASTPYNVAVGGTDFSDTYTGTNSTYWGPTNSSTFGSALSYVPEIPWNDSCAGALFASYEGYNITHGPNSFCNDPSLGSFVQSTVAGGGGPSACATGTPATAGVVGGTCQGWPKPSWQASFPGNPADGVRDTPDVSLFAADGLWGHYYIFCWSDTVNGGSPCTGDPSSWSGAGGTSFSSPILAGIQALANQNTGTRQGNPNPVYYQLAAVQYNAGNSACNSSNGTGVGGSCVFYDVTQGDMDVNCTGTANCFLDGAAQGVLSTSNNSFQPAYSAANGWDFATGIGSINATNLVNQWPGARPTFTLSASASSLSLTQGSNASTALVITPWNGFNGSVSLAASGLPSGVTAAFSPNPTPDSSTLTLTASSTASLGAFTVTVTGTSGSLTSSTSITLNVLSGQTFSLMASPNNLSILQGTSGTSTISVIPQNGFNSSVSFSASGLPNGVTASFNPSSTIDSSVLTLSANSAAVTGTVTLTITGSSGNLKQTTTVTLTVVPAPLPSGWADLDIGPVGPAGSASYANSTFTVNGSGQYVWNSVDGFNFAYQSLPYDATIVARVVSVSGGASSQSAGVMIRETLSASSTHAYVLYGGGNSEIYLTERSVTGGGSSALGNTAPLTLPYWVKLVRSGNNFSAFASPDGVNWTQVGATQTISMAASVYAGLAVSSNDNTLTTTATFDNVSITYAPASYTVSVSPSTLSVPQLGSGTSTVTVTPRNGFSGSVDLSASLPLPEGVTASFNPSNTTSSSTLTLSVDGTATVGSYPITITGTSGSLTQSATLTLNVTGGPLPSPWLDVDLGPVGPAGSATYSNGTFTVNGSGQYIWNNADGFNFAYQPFSGDLTIVARILSASGGAPGQSVGVMIRETLTAGSANAYALYGGGNSAMYLTERASTNGSSSAPGSSAPVTLPYWVKLVRSGNSFSAFASPDGVNWSALGSAQTIPMAANVYVGLAISSNDNTKLTTATFDNVSVTAPPPSFSLSASPNSLTLAQGASASSTITLTPQNGFSGSVTLSASGLPSGVTASFNPASTSISASSATSTLTLTASSSAATGTVTVTITGTSGSLTVTNTLSLTVTTAALPAGWTDLDIGPVGPVGSASYSNGIFTVKGSGQYIWNAADGFNFAYQAAAGDLTVVARILSATGGASGQSVGVMVRETLTAGSTNAYVLYGGGNSTIYLTERVTTSGGSSAPGNTAPVSLPYWVKLVRRGNVFTAFASPDGVNWAQVGPSQTINMATSVFAGLAISSNDNTRVTTATFDNVTITTP